MRIGISGHQHLGNADRWDWVRSEISKCLGSAPPPIEGISSLAVGADTLFARIVLDLGGSLTVVLPFPEYEQKFSSNEAKVEYRRLIKRATTIQIIQRRSTDEEAYYAAGKHVVDLSELIILVWNGKPAAGLGGTGDIAAYARRRGKRIVSLNPETRQVRYFGSAPA